MELVNKYLTLHILSPGHPAGPSVVDIVVDNPSDGKELRSKRQKALPPEECRETPTVETGPQVRDEVKFELFELPVKRPEIKYRYGKRTKTSAGIRELSHTLQESGGVGSRKEVVGKLGGQAKTELHTVSVQSSSQSIDVPSEASLTLAEEAELFPGTFLYSVHRQMKQSNLESSGVTDEVKTQRGATEGDPKVEVKQVADTGHEMPETTHREFVVLPGGSETRFGAAQGKLNVNEPERLPTPKHAVTLTIGLLSKCDKLINMCGKPRKFFYTGSEMPEMPRRESVVLSAKTGTTSGAIQDQLNINEPDTVPIAKHLLSLAMDVLTKCEKLTNTCKEITDVIPHQLARRTMAHFKNSLHPGLYFMLAEISFLIIKLFSELISAFMFLIYVIIHPECMDILPENITSSLDTLMVALLNLEIKYKMLCTRYIIKLNIFTPKELDETLQNYQTECVQIDTSEETDVSGERTKISSEMLQTLYEHDEALFLAPSEVPRCSLTLLEKDSIKTRLTVIGIKLSLIGEKILPLTSLKHPSQ
jgi:hypothetical protein